MRTIPGSAPSTLTRPPEVFQAGHVVVVELHDDLALEVLLVEHAIEARLLWDGFEVCHVPVGLA